MKQTRYGHSHNINAACKTVSAITAAFAIFVATSLTSCVKDELYDTPHPDKGAVTVTTDWTDALAESTVPDTYFLRMDNGEAVQASEETTVYPDLLAPGAHTLLVYNEPEGIVIEGDAATVQQQDGRLTPLPGYLFSAEKELEVVQDDTLHVSVPMVRRLCPIVLNLSLEGANTENIAAVTATLGGMAASVNLRTGTVGNENLAVLLDVQYTDTKERAYTEGKIEMKCRVVGTSPQERQVLTVKVTMADGYVQTITSDLTDRLKDLNAEMEPIELAGTVEAPQDGHFSGTIKDWDVVSGGDIDAN